MTLPTVRPLGDTTVLAEFEPVLDERVNARVHALAAAVRAGDVAGVRDIVPAYASLAVHLDPIATDVARVAAAVRQCAQSHRATDPPSDAAEVVIPVRYGGADGPDLVAVAAWAGLSAEDVVRSHAGRTYRVFMIGFLPGFPYMGVVDDRIAMPRRATPRARVAAGSVGIAGRQTGIYPIDSPGGWQLIGRSTCDLFDVDRDPPLLLQPGARVRFVPASPGVRGRGGHA